MASWGEAEGSECRWMGVDVGVDVLGSSRDHLNGWRLLMLVAIMLLILWKACGLWLNGYFFKRILLISIRWLLLYL